mgnify:CR=1 FL=1
MCSSDLHADLEGVVFAGIVAHQDGADRRSEVVWNAIEYLFERGARLVGNDEHSDFHITPR